MDEQQQPRTDTRRVVHAVVLVVLGGIGAAAGFTHTHDWATVHGQTGWLAWADAVVIEGLAVAAGFEVHRDHTRHRTPRLPAVVLVIAIVVQMSAQVALAEPTPAGWLLAAMPALGFLTVVTLVLRRTETTPTATDHHTSTEPVRMDTAPVEVAPVTVAPAASVQPAPSTVQTPTPPVPDTPRSPVRLPAAVRDTVTRLAHTAHTQGRPVTPEDIRPVIALPDAMLTTLITELNVTVDGHPASTG